MESFTGRWYSTFGPLDLVQKRSQVTGSYLGGQAQLEGKVTPDGLTFTYTEPNAAGEGHFQLVRTGKFEGRWRPVGLERWQPWSGVRLFEGLWQTSFGPLRLFQDGDRVQGGYEVVGPAMLTGTIKRQRLEFRYEEPRTCGRGRFTLHEDGQGFEGEWQADGVSLWRPWLGRRMTATPGVTWLIVLEAHWQTHLQDNEYAFGNMLREFFARVPGVKVRQRYFSSAEGLQKWCRETAYLPEPVVLVVATHGTAEGLTAHGQSIDAQALAQGLQLADDLRLLHLSACSTMAQGDEHAWYRSLGGRFPMSGYATAVDWAASAITEFLYLDMILSRGLSPAEAAAQVTQLLAFAGDDDPAASPYPPAQFRFLPAQPARL